MRMILVALVPAFFMLVKGSYSASKWLRQLARKYESVEMPDDGWLLYYFYLIFVSDKLSTWERLKGLGEFSPALVGTIVIFLLYLSV